MLRPQDGPTRERRRLDALWAFTLDPTDAGRSEGWWRGRLPDSREVPVPASFTDLFPDRAYRDHVGDVWYQTTVLVPRGWAGSRIVLRFDSATHRAVVWVDDVEVVAHEGGFTPFEADVTDHVRPGTSARITVVVDNRVSFQSLPPGIVDEGPDGRRQTAFHDFTNYAGLHRPVWLYCTPPTYVDDVTVVTGLEGTAGTVGYEIAVAGPDEPDVRVTLHDAEGVEVARGTGATGTLRVDDVRPWRPGEGYLYDLRVDLLAGEDVVDGYTLPVGVRTVAVRGTEFLINGEPFHFRGFGKHEDTLVRGRGHDDVMMVHDFALMDWIGANSFRTAHYPYAEEVLEYADRHGVVVIDEVAAVGQNFGMIGGFLQREFPPTFSPDALNDASREVHAQAIRELVARDKNHPSVVLWSLTNEPESDTEASVAYFEPLFALTRELDPTRPVGSANMIGAPHGRDRVQALGDVVMLNRYYGWYVDSGDLPAAEKALQAELEAWATEGKPILVSEYGADTLPGLHSLLAEPWSEEFQAELLETYHRVFDRVGAVVGEHVWNFADFSTPSNPGRVGGNRKGVFTRDRKPKASAFDLRRRWQQLR
ncbi:beta-glucuronidase [Blastococcus sp. SYSU DS0510]